RNLPEQEVADAHLSARADQEVGIRLAGRIEKFAEAALVEIVRSYPRRNGAPCGVDDLGAAAVIESDVEQHAAVALGLPDAGLQLVPHIVRQFFGAPDDLKANVVLEQGIELETQI